MTWFLRYPRNQQAPGDLPSYSINENAFSFENWLMIADLNCRPHWTGVLPITLRSSFENLSAMLWKSRIATTQNGERMASICWRRGWMLLLKFKFVKDRECIKGTVWVAPLRTSYCNIFFRTCKQQNTESLSHIGFAPMSPADMLLS